MIHTLIKAFSQLYVHVREGKNVGWPKGGMVTAENRLQVTAPRLLFSIEEAKNRVSNFNSSSHESPTS